MNIVYFKCSKNHVSARSNTGINLYCDICGTRKVIPLNKRETEKIKQCLRNLDK